LARRIEWLLLVLVLVAALGVRLYGLGFSLPFTIHPDEPNVVDHAVATLKTGDWNPHWFVYPSGYHYLQTGVMAAHLLWGIASGWYASPADLPDSSHVITSAPEAYLWARGTTALFGVLAVFLVYLLGRRLSGPAAGLAGALFLAFSPLHVENSHYVTTDVPTAALTLLAVYLALDVLERGGGGRALLAGLVVGLAGGFKYNAVVAAVPLLLAVGLRAARRGEALPLDLSPSRGGAGGEIVQPDRPASKGEAFPLDPSAGREEAVGEVIRPSRQARGNASPLLLVLLGVVLGYTLACPYTFADLPAFLEDLGYETHIYRFGGEAGVIRTYEVAPGVTLPPWQAYAHALWEENPPVALAYLGGVALALVRRRKAEMVLLSFVAAYYLFLASYASIFVRNILPALPGLAVLGGIFVAEGVSWLANRPPWRRPLARFSPLLLAIGLVAMLFSPARGILGADAFMSIPTSEVQARDWLDTHLAPGDKVAAELHSLLFARSPYHVTSVEYLSNYPLEVFVNLGYRYVVANSEHYGPEFARESTFPDYYLTLLSQMKRVADFPGDTQKLPGPRLTIFEVPQGELRPQHELSATAGPGLRVLGFDVGHRQEEGELAYVSAARPVRAGDVLGLTLYLQADSALPEDYLVAVRMRNAEGRAVASLEQAPCAGACPPPTWARGQVIADREDMPLAPVLPAGKYRLEVQFLRPGTKEALAIDPAGPEPGVLLLTEIDLLERQP
jgi:hypothetical protein